MAAIPIDIAAMPIELMVGEPFGLTKRFAEEKRVKDFVSQCLAV
jgi:hypothetical protein